MKKESQENAITNAFVAVLSAKSFTELSVLRARTVVLGTSIGSVAIAMADLCHHKRSHRCRATHRGLADICGFSSRPTMTKYIKTLTKMNLLTRKSNGEWDATTHAKMLAGKISEDKEKVVEDKKQAKRYKNERESKVVLGVIDTKSADKQAQHGGDGWDDATEPLMKMIRKYSGGDERQLIASIETVIDHCKAWKLQPEKQKKYFLAKIKELYDDGTYVQWMVSYVVAVNAFAANGVTRADMKIDTSMLLNIYQEYWKSGEYVNQTIASAILAFSLVLEENKMNLKWALQSIGNRSLQHDWGNENGSHAGAVGN